MTPGSGDWRLSDLRACFDGVIPSIVATVDEAGVPNVSYLSQVYFVDEAHVALSNQFFSKTAANVARRRRATLMVVDAGSGAQYVLDIEPVREEYDGELFARMSAHLDALSTRDGFGGVMKLRSADVYRVHAITAVPSPGAIEMPPSASPRPIALERLAALAAELAAEPDAGAMLDRALEGLEQALGIAHAMLLVPDEAGERLVTLASRGYPQGGVGSEVALGEGTIGLAGESRRPVRIADMSRGRRYVAAVSAGQAEAERHIVLPGLPLPQSQLAVPLLRQGRLVGVLFAESTERAAFSHEHEAALSLIALPLAAGLGLREEPDALRRPSTSAPIPTGGGTFRLRHHRFDDAVFLDDAYLIKGVAGRLLMLLVEGYRREGRTEFANRDIRRAPELRLPDLKDNLETRLLLLRRRLEEKQAPLRIVPAGRGLLRLEVAGTPLVEQAG
ncbi:GAF domain-containing protein [Ancylobacter sonchi]|uniref:GAF domain-containing protein n=1 Tax=Ancylobacter sonchi TaxID=1937790 RepID=UPI001BD35D71|nr:GAF domain-containing protein [Ancylobacter sonchi]MBS7532726.1 GAF domain-containing protein [Ancylobacter sonchi]